MSGSFMGGAGGQRGGCYLGSRSVASLVGGGERTLRQDPEWRGSGKKKGGTSIRVISGLRGMWGGRSSRRRGGDIKWGVAFQKGGEELL